MSVKSYFLILCLGIFIHAYARDARNIGVTDSDFLQKFQANDNKIADHKAKLGENSIQENGHDTNIARRILPSWIPSPPHSGIDNGCNQSGHGICESSIHKGLLNAAKLEDSRHQASLDDVLGSTNINIDEEDKILMDTADYQPPHRKTPIHNK